MNFRHRNVREFGKLARRCLVSSAALTGGKAARLHCRLRLFESCERLVVPVGGGAPGRRLQGDLIQIRTRESLRRQQAQAFAQSFGYNQELDLVFVARLNLGGANQRGNGSEAGGNASVLKQVPLCKSAT